MTTVELVSSKVRKTIIDYICSQYGCEYDTDDVFYINLKDNKIYLTTVPVSDVNISLIRLNSLGLYFGELNQALTEIRLSIEGSQLIGPIATQNVLVLSENDFRLWNHGHSVPYDKDDAHGYVIISNGVDFFSVARRKNDDLLNFVPKARWIRSKLNDSPD